MSRSMWAEPLLSITSRFQAPVMPSSGALGVTPASSSRASTRLSGRSTWLATMASSYSHQPERVKVWVVSCPSTSKVRVNRAPSSGSTPSSSSTWVSVAASSVPSWGRRPSTGSQYIQWASLASA